jgi:guanylate kinase
MAKLQHAFFVIMGPSGSGKTEVSGTVFPKSYKVVSHTTRPQRVGEIAGIDYYFETADSFQKLVTTQQLAEYDYYHGQWYGVGLQTIREHTQQHCAYSVLTFNGFKAVYQRFGEQVLPVFLDVSKANVLARLKKRESEANIIAERLQLYDEEIKIKSELMKYPKALLIDANPAFSQVTASLKNAVNQIEPLS